MIRKKQANANAARSPAITIKIWQS